MFIHGMWSMLWIDGKGLEGNMVGELVTIHFGEEASRYTYPSHWVKKIMNIFVPM